MPEGQSTIFFKQWGGKNKKQAGRLLDGQIWDQMPVDPSCQPDDQDAQLI
jgi:protein gp37